MLLSCKKLQEAARLIYSLALKASQPSFAITCMTAGWMISGKPYLPTGLTNVCLDACCLTLSSVISEVIKSIDLLDPSAVIRTFTSPNKPSDGMRNPTNYMMRLLTYDSNDNLHVSHDLADCEVKPYAILSHTWGKDEEEVLFHEIGSSTSQTKPGYQKIDFCGKQARQDGWEHFWVDTCCIDKRNNTELSEAIMSMYHWYQRAEVCYVYLSDVSFRSPSRTWEPSFLKLLAPRQVVFYSKEWHRLGAKDELEELLHNITGIPVAALKGQALSDFAVIERMRWTRGRDTKKKEDEAYCLLGIFGVSMSIRYGHGEGDNAFRRLQKKLDTRPMGEVADPRYDCKQHQCHRVFKTNQYEASKNRIQERVAGTCRWLLQHPGYLQWRETDHCNLLLISADPGCGKSVLSRSLVDQDLSGNPDTTVCYFFFEDNTEQDRLDLALCALLHQLFSHQPKLIRHAMNKWEENGGKIASEVDELWRILLKSVTDPEARRVVCVLDALDVCRDVHQKQLISMLRQFVKDTVRASPENTKLKFLVTSRPYNDIRDQFASIAGSSSFIHLFGEDQNDQIRGEIDVVIKHHVQGIIADFRLASTTADRLQRKLLAMENRTYLWLHLAIDNIRKRFQQSLRPDHESIEFLPASMEEAYELILSKVDHNQANLVRLILQIIVGARRPLTVTEMALALGIATSTKVPQCLSALDVREDHLVAQIRDWCGLFVYINHSRLYLIHQTAKEFLLRDPRQSWINCGKWKHCLSTRDMEGEMMRIFIIYLCLEEFETQEFEGQCSSSRLDLFLGRDHAQKKMDDRQNLFELASTSWTEHWRTFEAVADNILQEKVWMLYNTQRRCFSQWTKAMWRSHRPNSAIPKMTNLVLAAYNGHLGIIRRILSTSLEGLEVKSREYPAALIQAAWKGHYDIVIFLLGEGANINDKDGHFGGVVYAASFGGHLEVVQALIANGADVNAKGGAYGNALQAASTRGHLEVVRTLLDAGTEVNVQCGLHNSALQADAKRGHLEVVQTLLEKGADVNLQGGHLGNALCAASMEGHFEVVQLLLDKGASVNAKGGWNGNALTAACKYGHEMVSDLLLQHGAQLEQGTTMISRSSPRQNTVKASSASASQCSTQ